MGIGETRTEVSAVIANEIVAVGRFNRDYVELIYDNPCCKCDTCKSIVSVIYALPSHHMHLCLKCLEMWRMNPEWFALIALVTEAINVPL